MTSPGGVGMPEPPDDDAPSTEPIDIAPLMSMADLDRELALIAEDARRAAAAHTGSPAPATPDRPAIGDWHIVPARRRRYRPTKSVAIAAGAGAAVLALGIGGWVVLSGDDPAPAPVSHRSADAEAKLAALLPAGYAAGVCTPVEPTRGARAEIHCGRNTAAYGPRSASYSLFADPTALAGAFDQVVKAGTPVICPGNIMSPGPWHKGATPNVAAGTLLCTQIDNTPTVAWSATDQLLLSIVSDPGGFNQLNSWWTAHA